MSIEIIASAIQRRFILGCQGLWPGRRWSGKEGSAQALRHVEAVQIDPVTVVAQSHDIVLKGLSRFIDFLEAERVDGSGIDSAFLRNRVAEKLSD